MNSFGVNKPITLKVFPSTSLENATLEAKNLSKNLNTIVYFEFNGEKYFVFPDGYHSNHPFSRIF